MVETLAGFHLRGKGNENGNGDLNILNIKVLWLNYLGRGLLHINLQLDEVAFFTTGWTLVRLPFLLERGHMFSEYWG